MAKKEKETTKKAEVDLVAIATELNEAWGLDPAIDVEDGKKLKKNIIKEADGTLAVSDRELLSEATFTFLTVDCGIEPVEGEETPPPAPQKEKKKEKKEKTTKAFQSKDPTSTRTGAVGVILAKAKKLSKDDIVSKANALYTEKGGKDNPKETKWALGFVLPAFEAAGIVKVEGGLISRVTD